MSLLHAAAESQLARERVRNAETGEWCEDAEEAIEVRNRRYRQMHVTRLHVVAAGKSQSKRENEERDAERGAPWDFARIVEELMRRVVLSKRCVDPRPAEKQRHENGRQ
jgi:hypothetical protein